MNSGKGETHYVAYHRGFRDGWLAAMKQLEEQKKEPEPLDNLPALRSATEVLKEINQLIKPKKEE